jgi:hypothetical protein
MGVPVLTSADILSKESIVANVEAIDTSVGIEGTSNVYVFSDECNGEGEVGPAGTIVPSGNSGGSSSGSGTSGSATFKGICKKAKILHTATCTRTTSSGCISTTGTGNIITYGTIPSGTPKGGDAYDCDVNNDGVFDSKTERFYYVTSDGDESILIYYTNIDNQTVYAYDSSNENWHGPRTGYQYLPSTSEWKNPKIIAPGTRNIKNQLGTGTNYYMGSSYSIQSFIYTNKAARLLTTQELVEGCSSLSIGHFITGELDGCNWLLENIGDYEKDSGAWGYWLETPRADQKSCAWNVEGASRDVEYSDVYYLYYGFRPVITVLTSDIEI